MKKLRLLITQICNRDCVGCCNKDWNLKELPITNNFKGYDEIMLTGGEPMIVPERLLNIITEIRLQNIDAKIYIYTADLSNIPLVQYVLSRVDGLTITLHSSKDVLPFLLFLKQTSILDIVNKSIKINIFKGVKLPKYYSFDKLFQLRENMKWIKNCPLPQNEEFKRWLR